MAKILVVHPGPDFSVADVCRGWVKALRKLGHDVMVFNTNDRLAFYGQVLLPDLDKEVCPKCKRSATKKAVEEPLAIAQLATAGILEECFAFNPEIVFFVSAFFQNMNALSLMRKRGLKLVMLHTESPYQDEEQMGRGSLANLNLLNDPTNIERWAELGPVAYVPHSYDPDIHYPPTRPVTYESDFTFVGTSFYSRCEFFSQMNFEGLNVSLGGNGWDAIDPKFRKLYDYLGHHPSMCVDNDETARVYRVSKTGMNFYRREGEDEHQGEGYAMGPREIEMAACELFFIRDPRPESDEIFPMLPVFHDPHEAEDLIRYYVKHDEKRDALAALARDQIKNWTFDTRAKDVCKLMERCGIL